MTRIIGDEIVTMLLDYFDEQYVIDSRNYFKTFDLSIDTIYKMYKKALMHLDPAELAKGLQVMKDKHPNYPPAPWEIRKLCTKKSILVHYPIENKSYDQMREEYQGIAEDEMRKNKSLRSPPKEVWKRYKEWD